MKNLIIATLGFTCFTLVSCIHKLQPRANRSSSVIDLFKYVLHKSISERPDKHSTRAYIYERRKEAVKLFNIETDTSKLNRFIVIDIGNLEGVDYFGEIAVNDSLRYNYSSAYFLSDKRVAVKIRQHSPFANKKTEDFIFGYLNAHRFAELEAFANEKGKTLSGSIFYDIGMYEKGMGSVYVKLIPGFIIN
jgi:hypothetical protein